MRAAFFLILISISTSAAGEELGHCFYTHVQDAIELNRDRRELYKDETKGDSSKVSRYLILWEKLIRLQSKKYDRLARPYQEIGIPFMCEDFVDMSEVPAYIPTTSEIPRTYNSLFKPNSKSIKKKLRSKLKLGYLPFKEQLEIEIHKLDQNRSYDCLLKHLLESLLRSADLAPRYIAKAPQAKRRALSKLISKYLRLQIFGIGQALFIDKKARSIQAQGVPILCNDIPVVKLSPWK